MTYKPNDWWVMGDISGFKTRKSKTRKNWKGQVVRNQCFEERNAQEQVRGIREHQNVPDPRPRQTAVFIDPTETVEL